MPRTPGKGSPSLAVLAQRGEQGLCASSVPLPSSPELFPAGGWFSPTKTMAGDAGVSLLQSQGRGETGSQRRAGRAGRAGRPAV